MKDGLEYLWGPPTLNQAVLNSLDWWAHDHQEEEEAFIQFMDWAYSGGRGILTCIFTIMPPMRSLPSKEFRALWKTGGRAG